MMGYVAAGYGASALVERSHRLHSVIHQAIGGWDCHYLSLKSASFQTSRELRALNSSHA